VPSLLIPICFMNWLKCAGLSAPVDGLVFLAGFKFCAAFWSRFPGAGGCVCFSRIEGETPGSASIRAVSSAQAERAVVCSQVVYHLAGRPRERRLLGRRASSRPVFAQTSPKSTLACSVEPAGRAIGFAFAERRICIGLRSRVSLKSCSGASHGLEGVWWCRVCLLFENSIVCQVC
jgi:hypothetical protein